jgi:DNA invertase Pin-like site-specific DNA recombinase
MPARRSSDTMPDLFSAAMQPRADEPLASGFKTKVTLHNQGAASKHLLPSDLAGSLRRLEDREIDTLLAAVTAEADRRGRLPKQRPLTSPPDRPIAAEEPPRLTKGKLNAVRAAFRAGVKPSAIARQFGISQTDVKKALAQQ